MNRTHAERDAWHPHSREDRETVLRELEEILASPHFCNSKRYPALLRFLVENTLDGRGDLLKERTLGIEVFDRPPTFDTNSDTVVRYTAGEVRKRLQLYYTEPGRHSHLRIALPVGSYVPEFLPEPDRATEADAHADPGAHPTPAEAVGLPDQLAEVHAEAHPAPVEVQARDADSVPRGRLRRFLVWMIPATVVLLAAAAVWSWHTRAVHAQTALESFWAPVLHDQHFVLMCTGGVVFDQNKFSGVTTAGRDVDYPFVSMQNASAIADISGMLERSGATTQLVFSGSEPLTGLRENSVALLGAYNNQWTMRLLQPLRFHFAAGPGEAIVDQLHPQLRWQRDQSLPYSSADDYALLARYRDPTTDGWIVVVAGLGRNGTEAAAQFAISPHYLQLLRRELGKDLGARNLEAVLKVKVIDGKTGAPSLLAIHTW